jgi:hypothetical protein
MPPSLGPLPADLQEVVERWIDDGTKLNSPTDDLVCDAFLLCGGPGACYYLEGSGDILRWDTWDDAVTTLDDGPDKVSIIVCASQYLPELSTWLPVRPSHAQDCEPCNGTGWLLPPLPKVVCSACSGLGWLSTPD